MQSYPGEEEEELMAALKDFLRENYHDYDGLTIKRMYRYCRPAHTDPEYPAVQLLSECGMQYTPRARICGAMLSCDMFALTELGHIPSVIFGPIGERLHAPDEWVDLESMTRRQKAGPCFWRSYSRTKNQQDWSFAGQRFPGERACNSSNNFRRCKQWLLRWQMLA